MSLFALPFPVIDPVIVEIGPLAIRWYALSYIAGLALGWWVALRLVREKELFAGVAAPEARDLDDFLVWAMLGIVLGGRLGFVLFYNLPHYLENPIEALQVWHGGMSFHGGMAGIIAAAFLFARRRGFSGWTLMDIVATVGPLGLFFGRIANFINGELYGRVSDVPWAVKFPRGGFLPRHPSQLYEAGLEGLALFGVMMACALVLKVYRRPGLACGIFLVNYGAARFFVEFFREPDEQLGFLFAGVTMGQLLCLPMIGFGVMILLMFGKHKKSDA